MHRSYYVSTDSVSFQILDEYLKCCTILPGVKISSIKPFFSEVVTRFPAAHEHYYFLDFLQRIAERYREDNCEGSFVLDLLQLGVSKLFAG